LFFQNCSPSIKVKPSSATRATAFNTAAIR
jgi:hypothetical protein